MWIGFRSGAVAVGVLIGAIVASGNAISQTSTSPGTTATVAPQPGANSFSESQARQLVRDHGFSDVSSLVNDKQGIWHGTAKNGTGNVQVSVDFKGNVNAIPQ